MANVSHYDDPLFSYPDYWSGREYEHLSEIMALNRLLVGKHFNTITDIGGGYGRHLPTLAKFARRFTLVEPSQKMRALAARQIPDSLQSQVTIKSGLASATGLPPTSQDLVVVVRVLHHLPLLPPVLTEVARILRPSGFLVLEFANSAHFKARLSGRPIPAVPQDLRSPKNQKSGTIPFVNHRPDTVIVALSSCRLEPVRILSVSNFRHLLVKKLFPARLLLVLEWVAQPLLSRFFFGPSIFILARKC